MPIINYEYAIVQCKEANGRKAKQRFLRRGGEWKWDLLFSYKSIAESTEDLKEAAEKRGYNVSDVIFKALKEEYPSITNNILKPLVLEN